MNIKKAIKASKFNEQFYLNKKQEWFHQLVIYFKNNTNYMLYDFYKNLSDETDFIKLRQEFIIFILENTKQYYDLKKFKDVTSSIGSIINLWRTNPDGSDKSAWSAAIKKYSDKFIEILKQQ